VDIARDGEEGLFQACSASYDLLVLDLMLPKLTGLELLKRFRSEGRNSPVLVLTARDEKETVVELLNAGADDYLTKPFDLGEFVARSKALLRRGKGEHSPVIQSGPLEVNTVMRAVSVGGKPIALTAMEYRVLEYLALRLQLGAVRQRDRSLYLGPAEKAGRRCRRTAHPDGPWAGLFVEPGQRTPGSESSGRKPLALV
jgi:DNA-binding response OmpR family regulator